MGEKSRPRFHPVFGDFLEEKKSNKNESSLKVLAEEFPELKKELKSFAEEKGRETSDLEFLENDRDSLEDSLSDVI